MKRLPLAISLLALAAVAVVQPGLAQAQDYFIPGQNRPAAPAGPRQTAPSRPVQRAPVQVAPPMQQQQQEAEQPMPQVALPPVPELPALPKGNPPPAAVIGVMGVPEVMHASSAAQLVEKVIGERREKLNADAQKEQATWRDMQQTLANERTKLSPDQIRARERDLQERITNAQKTFRDRNRIIQEAAQVALGQIERTLIGVIRQVAESRGMNLVLHRAQVALNVNEFDITDQVAEQMNKILPTVAIPADGVSPVAQAPAPGTAPTATPASAPPAAPPRK